VDLDVDGHVVGVLISPAAPLGRFLLDPDHPKTKRVIATPRAVSG
jgi:hypothetical protein